MKTRISTSVLMMLVSFSSVALTLPPTGHVTLPSATAPTTIPAFRQTIEQAENACQDLRCAESGLTLQYVNLASLGGDTLQDMTNIVQNIANEEWPDTILEGPYASDAKVSITRVQAVIENGQTIGYRMTYAAQAWETKSCTYDPQDPNSLNACRPGRLVEVAFVDTALNEYFRDPKTMVEFKPAN